MHVLVRHNKLSFAAPIKKPAEGAAGKDHFKKWRERKTEIDYRFAPLRPLRLLQLLTKLGNP